MNSLDFFEERFKLLLSSGLSHEEAFITANFEEHIELNWPKEWGNTIKFVINGSIYIKDIVKFDEYKIILMPNENKTKIIALVDVNERTTKEYKNATKRLNELMGAISVTSLCNSIHYWSYIESAITTDVLVEIKKDNITQFLDSYNKYTSEKVKRHLYKALWWHRSFKHSSSSGQKRPSNFAHFTGLWNAFENIIIVVNHIKPIKEISEEDKKEYLKNYLKNKHENITLGDIKHLYNTCCSNSGFKTKAQNALEYCFGEQIGSEYFNRLYNKSNKNNGFYYIRNMIDHGGFIEGDFDHSKVVEVIIGEFEDMINNMLRKLFDFPQYEVK